MSKRILALAPHPDDSEIGCGGSLALFAKQNADVHLFIATDGSAGGCANNRRQEQIAAANIMGISKLHWGGFTDTKLPENFDQLLQKIEALVVHIKPHLVLVNHEDDTHQDHRTLAQAAHAATRHIANVLAYETPTSRHFSPSVFMDISTTLEQKNNALYAHETQVNRTNIHGLSIFDVATSTAHFRGIQGRINSAEGFMPVRMRLNDFF